MVVVVVRNCVTVSIIFLYAKDRWYSNGVIRVFFGNAFGLRLKVLFKVHFDAFSCDFGFLICLRYNHQKALEKAPTPKYQTHNERSLKHFMVVSQSVRLM